MVMIFIYFELDYAELFEKWYQHVEYIIEQNNLVLMTGHQWQVSIMTRVGFQWYVILACKMYEIVNNLPYHDMIFWYQSYAAVLTWLQ